MSKVPSMLGDGYLFLHRAYLTGVRVNHASAGAPYIHSAHIHLVILAQPSPDDTKTYLVDVGFGSSCLLRPLLLSADPDNFVYGLNETERHRLTYSPREDSSQGVLYSLFLPT
jgi:arylamine N-acetyltransferase